MLVGLAPRTLDVDIVRRKARHAGCDVLVGVQGTRLVVVIGRAAPEADETAEEPIEFLSIAGQLAEGFGEGHLVLDTHDGRRIVTAGDVIHLRPA